MKVYQGKNKQKDIFEMLPHAINALKKNIIDPFFGSSGISQNSNEKLTVAV